MKKIAIIGSGGLGREVLGIIQAINQKENTWNFIGFYDDNDSEELINGYPIIGEIKDLNLVNQELHIIIAIGNPIIKEKIERKINNSKIIFPNIIHPSVILYSIETIVLGKGIVIGANCVLTVNINLGNYVYINTASIISHDVSIGDYSMVMPTVSISAGASIGKCVYIGNGVKIDYPVLIEDDKIIKTGAILTQ